MTKQELEALWGRSLTDVEYSNIEAVRTQLPNTTQEEFARLSPELFGDIEFLAKQRQVCEELCDSRLDALSNIAECVGSGHIEEVKSILKDALGRLAYFQCMTSGENARLSSDDLQDLHSLLGDVSMHSNFDDSIKY